MTSTLPTPNPSDDESAEVEGYYVRLKAHEQPSETDDTAQVEGHRFKVGAVDQQDDDNGTEALGRWGAVDPAEDNGEVEGHTMRFEAVEQPTDADASEDAPKVEGHIMRIKTHEQPNEDDPETGDAESGVKVHLPHQRAPHFARFFEQSRRRVSCRRDHVIMNILRGDIATEFPSPGTYTSGGPLTPLGFTDRDGIDR